MICNEEHCLFIFICSIFARYFELSNIRGSMKSGQATKSPERTHRALKEVPSVSRALHLAWPLPAGDFRMHGPFTLMTPDL